MPLDVIPHRPILKSRSLVWADEADCSACAQRLAAASSALDSVFIELRGPLGAGKTTFVRHLLRALGVTGRIKSPTYAVLEPYALDSGLAVSHFDFYRFSDPREWEDAGFRDIFATPGLKIAEWPDKAAGVLPVADLQLAIDPTDDSRREVLAQALTPQGVQLLEALA